VPQPFGTSLSESQQLKLLSSMPERDLAGGQA